MEKWNEFSEKVSKLSPDTEKAKALLNMVNLREERIKLTPFPNFATLLTEEYYEIIKELMTAIMCADGWKTTSHEILIGYLAEFYTEVSRSNISLIDQLRVIRNDINYRGVKINPEYLQRNKKTITNIIKELKEILKKKN